MSDLSPLAIHAILEDAHDHVANLRGNYDGLSNDSAFAIGQALGQLAKAKALVGRDIDDARTSARHEAALETQRVRFDGISP